MPTIPIVDGPALALALGYASPTAAMDSAAATADQLLRQYVDQGKAFPHGVDGPAAAPVHEAALAVAIDVLQSRTAAGGNSVGLDGSTGPYRMGRQLLDRVSGLLGPYLAVGSEVG